MVRWLSLLFIGCCSFSWASGASQEPAQQGYAGMEMCEICHEEVATALKKSPHWAAYKLKMPSEEARGCESCHGPSDSHANDPTEPVFAFRDESARDKSARCAACHEGRSGRDYLRGVHQLEGLSCDTCHGSGHGEIRLHSRLLKSDQPGICLECHVEQSAQMQMPFRHRTSDGVLKCSDCHQVHGKSVRRQAELARVEACKNCHVDKKGPFMFEHTVNTVTGCVSCHTPHGSTNPKLLNRAQVRFLCLECHPDTTRFHNLSETRFQNCTLCHTGIHGSHFDPKFLR